MTKMSVDMAEISICESY